MKFKTLPIVRYYAGSLIIFLYFVLPSIFFLFMIFSDHIPQEIKTELIAIIGVFLFLSICLIQIGFWEKCFSYVIIKDDIIKWCCPLRKSIAITLNDCKQIGLEFENAYVKGVYPYIYFVTFPYSQENSKYYGKVKCCSGLIKFRYTNKLAEYLINNYSQKTSYALCQYYRKHKKDKWFY